MIPHGCIELCPGCRFRQLTCDESNARKQAWAEEWLLPLTSQISPIKSPKERWGYRRRALLHAELGAEGWRLGLLKRRGWEADLIEIPDCPLHAPEVNAVFAALKRLLNQQRDLPLAFVLLSGGILTLVLKCHAQERWRAWALSTEQYLGKVGVESLQVNWNPSAGRRVISSRHQELIFGTAFAHDGEHFYGALSFRQQIPELEIMAEKMAEEFFSGFALSRIVDLYCGSGATLARWEKLGWKGIGIELSGEATIAAKKNAPAVQLLKGKVEQRVPQINEWLTKEKSNFLLYTNPPRSGHALEVNEWILAAQPAAIAYLSCNPKTLGQDLLALSSIYRTKMIQPFDFFPQTDHVESLALLVKK